ncbi:MAG: GGDEF domain-containing protein [Betaproteobacteria bacterium]|nr:GGDEF domain-containing protein [Betaproteobacteria bacterium]
MSLTPGDHDLVIGSSWSLGQRSGLLLLAMLVPAILLFDFVSGKGVSLQLFYLVPVGIAAWTLGARAGYAIAAATGLSWAFVALASRGMESTLGALAWEIGSTFGLYLFVAHVLTRHRRFMEGLRATARVDGETGALSRREFDRILDSEVRRSRRYRRPLALLLFDIAEVRGQAAGHLAAAVRSLQAQAREVDSVARIADRHFAVLLIECKEPEPTLVYERLRDVLVTNLRLAATDVAAGLVIYRGASVISGGTLLALAESHAALAKTGTGFAEAQAD